MDEATIIDALRARLGEERRAPHGIGDDGALLRASDGRVVVLDTLVEGVHFDLRWSSLADVAHKSIAVNASDVFAMRARPTAWLLSLSLPPERAHRADVDALAAGFAAGCARWAPGAALVGGDTVRSPGGVALTVTMFGALEGDVLTRGGAEVGHGVFVDGVLGHAAAGLALLASGRDGAPELLRAHRAPASIGAGVPPSVASAGIDVSDGLLVDGGRLADASGVGLRVDAASLPGQGALRAPAASLGVDALDWALAGGDDYVRLVTAPDTLGSPWTRIGTVVPRDEGVSVVYPDGRVDTPGPRGFQHFDPERGT